MNEFRFPSSNPYYKKPTNFGRRFHHEENEEKKTSGGGFSKEEPKIDELTTEEKELSATYNRFKQVYEDLDNARKEIHYWLHARSRTLDSLHKVASCCSRINRNIRISITDLDVADNPYLKKLDSALEILCRTTMGEDVGWKAKDVKNQLDAMNQVELAMPEIEKVVKAKIIPFEIPKELRKNLDLNDAVVCYRYGCYPSAQVACRRAYEGALAKAYEIITKEPPLEKNGYFKGVRALHDWAYKRHLVDIRTDSLGSLVADLGANGAHPPLEAFPRDKQTAKLAIETTITLLKELDRNVRQIEVKKA
ncbi:MAG: hypothetical protein AB1468_00210 [Candidatus Micrarchaeota archaeon]